mmetsp:Transcript_78101/g.211249  ORF Transcript_78101/g.211249 Transcript_78101/m.211249 type:complete len:218 (-) Transcript_78101:248-901(-)
MISTRVGPRALARSTVLRSIMLRSAVGARNATRTVLANRTPPSAGSRLHASWTRKQPPYGTSCISQHELKRTELTPSTVPGSTDTQTRTEARVEVGANADGGHCRREHTFRLLQRGPSAAAPASAGSASGSQGPTSSSEQPEAAMSSSTSEPRHSSESKAEASGPKGNSGRSTSTTVCAPSSAPVSSGPPAAAKSRRQRRRRQGSSALLPPHSWSPW